MKRLLSLILCFILLISFSGCNSNKELLKTGIFYTDGEFLVSDIMEFEPYIIINEDKTFSLGMDTMLSFAEYGTYEIQDNKLIATSHSGFYEFEIKDNETLILVAISSDVLQIPLNKQFVYKEKLL